MQAKAVLISGAGIAGPTLAYWLMQGGFEPTLVEHASKLRTSGYIIDFWGSGYDVAERMGLVPELRREGYDVSELRLVDAQGRRVGGFGANVFRELTDGRYVSLPRGDLAKLVYRRIERGCETIFGDSIKEIDARPDGVHVTFDKAADRRFDLVIGADGLRSQVRRLAFGADENFEKYLGYTVAAFEAHGYRPRDELVYVSYSVPGKQVARFAMREDRTMFMFVFASDAPLDIDPHDIEAQKKVLHATFGNTGWECPQILATLDRCDDVYFDRVSQIHMDCWSKGRVALLGDAAYCVSLLAGQGSALAMAGAYILAGELTQARDDVATTFHRYETLLRPLIATKQKAAEQFAGSFAPRTKLALFLRNQITKSFAIPFVAKFAIGNSLVDRIELPDYGAEEVAG